MEPTHCLRTSVRAAAAVGAVSLVVGTSCTGTDGERGWTTADSAGIRIVEHSSAPPAVTEWAVDLDAATPLATPPEMGELFRVRGAVRLPDGGAAVADGGNHRVVFFDALGAVRGTQGGQGEGPGEYQRLDLVARWMGDSLAVWDSQARRMSVLDSDGAYARSFTLETTEEIPFANVRGVYADGSLLATGFVAVPEGEVPDGRRSYSAPLYHFSRDGRPVAELGLVPTGETFYQAMNGGFAAWPALFARRGVVHPALDRLVLGFGDRYELRVVTQDGEPTMIVRRTDEPTPITAAMREVEEQALLAPMSADAAERARAAFAEMPIPEVAPFFEAVFTDRVGRVWVQEFEPGTPETTEWRAYGPDGALVGRAHLSGGLEPLEVGSDYLLGLITDDLGVEHVVDAPWGPPEEGR